ncbi:MAG: hypothetical protein KAY24_03525 [Candidatus Eisenbacteria sp.]|nr:hypothetical protein [Candidatus Eisenbacteria bacterium]
MTSAWQERRSQFNHDWLKNQYMPALHKWLNIMDGKVEDAAFEATFVEHTLRMWESHRQEAKGLPEEFEGQMSPSCLFAQKPLSRCNEGAKDWLPELAHHLWLSRYPVKTWIDHGKACAEAADASYVRLQQEIKSCTGSGSKEVLIALRDLFLDFLQRCLALARAIETFPSDVMAA